MTRSSVVEELRSRTANSPPEPPAHNGNRQVLLVDGEIERLLPLADALHRAGFVPTIATSGDEATFDVETSPPDVVVVDAEMACGSLLSALISKLPLVLMVSVPTQNPQIAAMLAMPGVACIGKPIRARELVALLSDSSRFAENADRS